MAANTDSSGGDNQQWPMYDINGRIIGYGPPGHLGQSYDGYGMPAITWLYNMGGQATNAYLADYGESPAGGTTNNDSDEWYPGYNPGGQPPGQPGGVAAAPPSNGKVYTLFGPGDIRPDETQIISQTVWSDGNSRLTTFYTSSIQSASNAQYYYDVYNAPPSDSTASVQFAVAYGDYEGSGSTDLNADAGQAGFSPSRAVYSSYANVLLTPGDDIFTLGNGANAESIIAINFQRERIKQKIDPGNWEIWTSGSLGPESQSVCIDDSGATTNPTINQAGRVFNIVSGSIANGVYEPTAPVYIGMVYPDMGMMIMDAEQLSSSFCIDCAKRNSNTIDNNNFSYITAVSKSATIDFDHGMAVRNEQQVTSTFYFVRVKNAEYNFSNNPTFVTGSEGQLRYAGMINNPQVYVTGIGLYNDAAELLAVAKVSRPILKNFYNEMLCKVRLTY